MMKKVPLKNGTTPYHEQVKLPPPPGSSNLSIVRTKVMLSVLWVMSFGILIRFKGIPRYRVKKNESTVVVLLSYNPNGCVRVTMQYSHTNMNNDINKK